MAKTYEEVQAELRQASDGLLWMSESDYPFEVVEADAGGEVEEAVKSLSGNPSAGIERRTVAEFFRPAVTAHEGQTEERAATVERFRRLVEVINRGLAEASVYRVGDTQVQVFILGRTGDGKLTGLKTVSIET